MPAPRRPCGPGTAERACGGFGDLFGHVLGRGRRERAHALPYGPRGSTVHEGRANTWSTQPAVRQRPPGSAGNSLGAPHRRQQSERRGG
ncbi:hypothetical protein SHJG_3972 [Streptomyces hygroscopicus subsp. jinggangensis 5008]|nr:hypothetical protein SHJG_3972 [Streptomyces hygroscopicus subsp. jinggangensis 5008]AGF63402.1 hypothetical protein SHJGH_3737 [Streptomyces hygroscopicus subsp. jinggangensis TL01]